MPAIKKTIAAGLLFLAALLIGTLARSPGQTLGNDGVQYLVGARGLAAGAGYTTPILFFDEHYAAAALPAPQTVWPPGYPFLIASAGLLQIEPAAAALLISRISFALLVVLVFFLSLRLTASPAFAGAAVLWQLAASEYWQYAAAVNSDLPFTVICLTMLLLWHSAPTLIRTALISLLAGAAFATRYAGFFPLALVSAFFLWRAVILAREKGATACLRQLAAALPGPLIFLVLVWRNWLLTGGLQGGNTKVVYHPLSGLLITTVKSLLDLLFGITSLEFKGGMAVASLAALAVILTAAAAGLAAAALRKGSRLRAGQGFVLMSLVTFVLLYSAGMIWVGRTTMLTFDSRYFLPVVPAVICLCAALLSLLEGRQRLLALSMVVIIIVLQLGVYPRRVRGYQRFAAPQDLQAVEWLRKHAPANDTLLIVGNGQRLGFYSNHTTLAVPEREFTSYEWDEQRLREVSRKYQANLFVVGKTILPSEYSSFPLRLAAGQTVPWLERVMETERTYIYRIRP